MPEENPTGNTPDGEANLAFDIEKAKDYRIVYSNQTAFTSTAFDFGMVFGQITDISADATSAKVEQYVKVIMSPLHFKIFVTVAGQNLKGYEDKFGKIGVPNPAIIEQKS